MGKKTRSKKTYNFRTFLGYVISFTLGIICTFSAASFLDGKEAVEKVISRAVDIGKSSFTDNAWDLPRSTKKGFPVVDNETNELSIYNLKTNLIKSTGFKANRRLGTSGLGSSFPIFSPDFLYSAFIDFESNVLYVMSNENFETVEVDVQGTPSYLVDWSPDGEKFIYYVEEKSLGFFVVNVSTGEITGLGPIEYVEIFIDSSKILARTNVESDKLVVFDLDSFEADHNAIPDEFVFGAGKFSFSNDGTMWAFTYSDDPSENANIVYSEFPNRKGRVIETGKWDEFQWPLVSADGTKIAYQRTHEYENGAPVNFTWVFDSVEKSKKKLSEGKPVAWIDKDSIVLETTSEDNEIAYLTISTNSSTSKIE